VALADTGLRFWLGCVERAGGLWEDAGASTVVLLPPRMQEQYRYPDEVRVTTDPDVAREDGATLLLPGHPWLMQAAESVLGEGDCGLVRLPRPTSPPPTTEQLLAAAREQFPVDHGRIDAAAGAVPGVRPLVRVGALVTYAVSSDVSFQELAECWVDVASCLEAPDDVVARLSRLVDAERSEGPVGPPPEEQLAPALRHAHERIDQCAGERESDLSRQAADDRAREEKRAVAYYDEALRSLQRRLDTSAPDRAVTLSAKVANTRAERDRRLAEIAEKYRATHTIRPFRLHVIGVPVLRLAVDVRRGERRHPLVLDWLLPARRFAGIRCPACGSTATLAAAKAGLGCLDCLGKSDPRPEPAPVAGRHRPAEPSPPPATPPPGSPAQVRRPRPRPERVRPSPSRTPQAPPRTPQAVQKAGHKLAASLWDLAVAGDRRIQRGYAPHSPAAAMHALFGAGGPLRAVGVDAGEVPVSMSTSDSQPSGPGSGMFLVDGVLHTASNSYGYQLCWRFAGTTALVEEVTPFPGAYWPRQPEPRYNPAGLVGRRLYAAAPPPRASLDAVASTLWRSVTRYGLPLILRCLAAWWRVADADQLLAAHPPDALAAGVARMIAYRAGAGGRYDATSATFGVDVAAVRAAATELQRLLRLSGDCPW
jgi:hypothetical protein